jgi:integrase
MNHFKSEKFNSILFCNDEGIPLVMPSIFSHSLHSKRIKYRLAYIDEGNRRIKKAELVSQNVAKTTIPKIINELNNFLLWLEEYSRDKNYISLELHHNIPVEILNYYINEVIIIQKSKSKPMVIKALNALRAYYNFLTYNGFNDLKIINIEPDNLNVANENTKHRGVVKYFSEGLRAQIYANAKNLRDESILRAGGTCGVRAKENIGFLLKDFKAGGNHYKGLDSLFSEMKENPNQQDFEFYLQGKYSKSINGQGGISRMLYIPKETLKCFKKYKDKERPECDIDNLFVTDPSSGHLKEISVKCVERAFDDVRSTILKKQEMGLLPEYLDSLQLKQSYHILRHSFGTDTFYDAVQENGMKIDDVTHMSQPYLVTARLLGHVTTGKEAPKTTRDYIRSCHVKINLINEI